jgi:hypothetical protein
MWTRLAALGLGAIAIIALTAVDATEQDLRCEEAVAHLKDCCGDSFDPHSVNCTTSGCNSHPSLTVDESQCISSAICAGIIAHNLCGFVAHLSDLHPPDGGPICPGSVADQ